MPNYRRDAALAGCSLAALVALLAWQGATAVLLAPAPAAVGVAGALLVEAAFLRVPAVARAWKRPAVQAGGTLVMLAGALAARAVAGPAAVAAVCWGLLSYFALLVAALLRGRA